MTSDSLADGGKQFNLPPSHLNPSMPKLDPPHSELVPAGILNICYFITLHLLHLKIGQIFNIEGQKAR